MFSPEGHQPGLCLESTIPSDPRAPGNILGMFLQTLSLLSLADVTVFAPESQLEELGATLGNSPPLLAPNIS